MVTMSAAFDNYFTLFKQPIQFELSQSDLDNQLRQLQKQFHPDHVNEDSSQAWQAAEQTSAVINQAYQTLSHPDSRAAYLLTLADQGQNLEQSIADIEFLDDAMQLRIDLDDAIEMTDAATLSALKPQIDARLQAQSKRFLLSYETSDWDTAIDATQKLKFLVKLAADVARGLDTVANQNSDDDDLYV